MLKKKVPTEYVLSATEQQEFDDLDEQKNKLLIARQELESQLRTISKNIYEIERKILVLQSHEVEDTELKNILLEKLVRKTSLDVQAIYNKNTKNTKLKISHFRSLPDLRKFFAMFVDNPKLKLIDPNNSAMYVEIKLDILHRAQLLAGLQQASDIPAIRAATPGLFLKW